MKAISILFAATLLAIGPSEAASAAPAPPPPATTAACLIVSNIFAKHSTGEKERSLAQSALYFFIGRIDDRTTAEQLKLELKQQHQLITGANAAALMNACVRQMQAKSQMLQAVGQQLQQGH